MKPSRQRVLNAILQTWREMRTSIYVPNPKTRGKTSSGNMALNALRIRVTGDVVDVFIDEEIAPYAVYTDEPWTSEKWKVKQNPNEGWWERFCEEFARRLAKKLRGKLK